MTEQNPIDSLFRDGLKEAQFQAPEGVWEAVQSQVGSASTTAAGTSLAKTVVGWKWALVGLGAAAISTFALWEPHAAGSNSARVESVEAPIVAENQVPSPLESSVAAISDGPGLTPGQEASSPSTVDAQPAMDTSIKQPAQFPVSPAAEAHSAPVLGPQKPAPKTSSIACLGMAKGQLSDLPGSCVRFEGFSEGAQRQYWRVDGHVRNQVSGTECLEFGQRKKVALVLIAEDFRACKDSQVYWLEAPVFEEPKFVIPDVITPNGDGLNDAFYLVLEPRPLQYELLIFDQLNRLVFRSENPDEAWKAQCYQSPCPAGLYRVVVTTRFEGSSEARVIRQPLIIKK
ncbi:MAG: gliding motility-associated C-terminal domain-containing protein [Bacteroidia bacterium]